MGNTAEAVANQFKVSREDQDEFAYNSHMKALKAQAENRFQDQIVPITVDQTYIDENGKKSNQKPTRSIKMKDQDKERTLKLWQNCVLFLPKAEVLLQETLLK